MKFFRSKWSLGRRFGIYLALVGSLAVVVFPGLFLVVDDDDVHAADAIIVIGGDHKWERVRRAVELYQQGYAPVVIISAGTVVLEGNEWLSEAEVMRRQALTLGLPDKVIILEAESFTTVENAHYSRLICQEQGLDSILLVTSAYHSRRARRIFRDALGKEISIAVQPAPLRSPALLWWLYPNQARVALYEYWNWIVCYFQRIGDWRFYD
jgi:uncharacterized SAM-binding protein YcdF (DUF218 family)